MHELALLERLSFRQSRTQTYAKLARRGQLLKEVRNVRRSDKGLTNVKRLGCVDGILVHKSVEKAQGQPGTANEGVGGSGVGVEHAQAVHVRVRDRAADSANTTCPAVRPGRHPRPFQRPASALALC
jgi:hypothetical protein